MTVPAGRPSNGSEAGSSISAEEALDVERQGRHAVDDPPFPHVAWAVAVDLDPMAVGIGEVQRLAHEVIREPDEPNPIASSVCEPAREVDAFRKEQREVVEAGVAGSWASVALFDENEELAFFRYREMRVQRRCSRTSRPTAVR